MKTHLLTALLAVFLLLSPKVNFGQAPNFGTASTFGVFTGAGAITNEGNSEITGDLGTFAGALTGFPPGNVNGTIYPVGDPYLNEVKADVEAAYTNLSTRTCETTLEDPTLGKGQILTPGVYCNGSAATLEGELILDAQGDPNAIFIFQIGGAFATSANSTITLLNGACLDNVYWQIGGAFTLGQNSVFRGTIIADGQIELLEGSTLYGRALAVTGAILLHNNEVTVPATQAEAPIVSVVAPTCEEPGSATITNFNEAYTHVFSPAGPVVDESGVITGFTTGVAYTVTANNTDNCGSSASAQFTIKEAEAAPAQPLVVVVQPTCEEPGSITVTAPLGKGMMYSLNGGTYQASVTFGSLAAGNYTVIARNAAGCVSGRTAVTINNAPNAPAAPTATVTQPTCLVPKGMITITAPTGTGLVYSLNGGTYQASVNFGELMPGTYTLTARNAAGCVSAGTTKVVNDQPSARTPVVECHTIGFGYDEYEKGQITTLHTPEGPVSVMGRKRNADGTYATQNHAALFDTQSPTGDDTDLYTTDWGLALIINQDQTSVPNDNQWGGELILDFSAIGPVTMKSLKALDIDGYENMSWIYLYDGAGNELYRVQLQDLGNNSKQEVNLGNTKGVMSMRVVLDGRNDAGSLAGSGAIDDIRFCVEEEVDSPCVDVQGDVKAMSITNATGYPTPFTDRATVEFRLRNTENYVVNLYDTKGVLIRQLKTGTAVAGELNTIEVDGRNLSEGLYLARIASVSGFKTVKLILKK